MALVGRVSSQRCPGPQRGLLGCLLGHSLVGVQNLTVHGVPRCERYGVVPLARMVQQNQYHPSLPAEESSGKRRNFYRAGRKQLRQELRAKPGRRQAQRPKTAQQPQGPGTPVWARDKAELTRHPAVQWGLEPGPATALTVSGQDLVGAEQGAGSSAHPWYGSIGSSPATAQCGATPVPAVKGHRQQGELVTVGSKYTLQLGWPKALGLVGSCAGHAAYLPALLRPKQGMQMQQAPG